VGTRFLSFLVLRLKISGTTGIPLLHGEHGMNRDIFTFFYIMPVIYLEVLINYLKDLR
jgi:hypothetical protein